MMGNSERRSILCPGCKRLISVDESPCPHCGLRNPGARWRNNFWTRGFQHGDQLIRNILYLNAAMFLLSVILNPTSTRFSMNPFDFLSPDNRSLLLLGATGTIPIDKFHRWWTLLSASYLHAGMLHIMFNMVALYQIAPIVIQEYGGYRMICIYTLSGAGGYVVSYFAGIPFTLGASAAVCGLIGATLYYGRSRGGYFGQLIYRQVGGWVLGIFIFGFLFPGINNWAHGGGLVWGILTGFLGGYREKTDEHLVHKVVAGICVVATLGALSWGIVSSLLLLMQARLT
jgi:rhomboid protease GluP